MSSLIPLKAVPSQTLSITLGGQRCLIKLYQKTTGTFIDLTSNNVSIVCGMVCLDRVRIVRHAYLGFIGNLTFIDTQGTSDPEYTGFGTRYKLVYLP